MSSQTDIAAGLDAALKYLTDNAEAHMRRLDDFLRIESVSADPERKGAVREAGEWVADWMREMGIQQVMVHETASHPIVTGEWLGAGEDAPTVLVYCHYDVQPADPLDEWVRPPFEPRYEDDIVYARGSGDDKGQLMMHLAAAEAWLKGAGGAPVNLRFFFEGDEEVGSEPAERFIAEHGDLLRADLAVVTDSDMADDDSTPAITYGLRGIAYFEIKVRGSNQDLHSGQFGGGVDNPANVLVRILDGLVDADGRVTVPGFYDRVRDLTDDERAAYAAQPFDPQVEQDRIGIRAWGEGERGWTLLERMSGRPTFDINGLWGGYSGEGAKTIIPAWAAAKFSTRLVPDQDYREIEGLVARHVESLVPETVTATVRIIHGGAPAITPLDHPGVRLGAEALEAAFGKAPLYHRSGGSVPVVAALDTTLGLKSVLIGFASPNGNFHSPNEWMPLWNVRGGMDAIVRLWERFGSVGADELRR